MPYSHFWKLLVCLSTASWVAAARAEAPPVRVERELLVSGDQGAQPLLIYGVPDVMVTVVVNEPVLRQDIRSPPGLDIRPHPFRDDAILVMPASALVAQKAETFSVPLVGGTVLTFTVVPARGAGDALVRVRRAPPPSEREAHARRERELRTTLVHAVSVAVGAEDLCTLTAAEGVGATIDQDFACKLAGDRAYVRMKAYCSGATVRLVAPHEGGVSLDFEQTECTPKGDCVATLVVRREGTEPRGATIELRGENGGLCRSYTLQPW